MVIRTRYTVEEIQATGAYTFFNIGNEGYAVENNDYTSCVVSNPFYKFHKGNYQRCYLDPQILSMHLRIESQKEWQAS